MNTAPPSDRDRKQEDADLEEIKGINDQIKKLEARKATVVQGLLQRYHAAAASPERRKDVPAFDDPLQRHAYDYLLQVKSSTTKPMGDYCTAQGYDFHGSTKPGNKIIQSLRKCPDVFKYDKETAKWSLVGV